MRGAADYDSWKLRSDRDEYPDEEEGDAVCVPCQGAEHGRCWHDGVYARCECFLTGHNSQEGGDDGNGIVERSI